MRARDHANSPRRRRRSGPGARAPVLARHARAAPPSSADLPDQGVRAALLACGSAEMEVLAPIGPDTGVARFLESRGEGLHHLCFESDDVVREVRRFIGTGVDMVDGKPRQGLAGKIAFVHPRACAKLLVELATPSAPSSLPATSLGLVAVHGKVETVGEAAQRFQDLFGMSRGFAADDGSFVQLSLAGVMLQLDAGRGRESEARVHRAPPEDGRPAGDGPAARRARRPVPGATPWDSWSPRDRAGAPRSSWSPAADGLEEDSRVRLKGQVALVTGGGTGIGRGISLAFAREGAAVAVNYQKSRDKAEETVRRSARRRAGDRPPGRRAPRGRLQAAGGLGRARVGAARRAREQRRLDDAGPARRPRSPDRRDLAARCSTRTSWARGTASSTRRP